MSEIWSILSKIVSRRSFVRYVSSFSALFGCSLGGFFKSLSKAISEDKPSTVSTVTELPHHAISDANELDVIIIGAGITGLSAGFYLDDLNICILEKNERAGGRTISGKYKQFSYAKGTEYLGYPEGALKEIIRDLKLSPVEIPSPMDAHFEDGKFFYGFEGLAIMHIENSSVEEFNRFMSDVLDVYDEYEEIPDYDPSNEIAWLDKITAGHWFKDNEFSSSFRHAYNGTARGLFGANLDEISALSYIPEIAFDFEDEDPIEDVDNLENTPNQPREHSEAYTFMTGITEVTDSLASYLKDKIQYQAAVQSVSSKDRRYHVTYLNNEGKEQTLVSKTILLATPAPVTSKIASPVLNREQKEILDQIPYSVYATVSLFCSQPVFDRAFDLSVPDDYFFTDIYDSTWVQRHLDTSLKETEESILTIYVAPSSYMDKSLLSLSEEELLENIYRDLQTIFPKIRDVTTGYDTQYFEYAYPVMTMGAYQRLTRLHEITDNKLQLAGDYMIYPTFEAAADSGKLAARKVKKLI